MHRVFPPALVAAIRDDRVPLGGQVEAIAAKMWCEAFPARTTKNWYDLPKSSTERHRILQAAEIALGGTCERPVAFAA
jgi:hypothetical protein